VIEYANRYAEFAQAFGIFAQYAPGETWGVSAEHDVIYAGGHLSIDQADQERLQALGWVFDHGLDCWRKFT
jgi:hypothetical protein